MSAKWKKCFKIVHIFSWNTLPILLAPFWCIQHVFYLDLLSSQLPEWVIPYTQNCGFWALVTPVHADLNQPIVTLVCIPDKIYQCYIDQNIITYKINIEIMDLWNIFGTIRLHTSKCIPASASGLSSPRFKYIVRTLRDQTFNVGYVTVFIWYVTNTIKSNE